MTSAIFERIDALLAMPSVTGAVVSYDGRHVAFVWRQKTPVRNVWAMPTDGSAPPRQLTDGSSHSWMKSWAPDSKSLVVGSDDDGDERTQLFRVTLDGTSSPLTEPHPSFFPVGGRLDPPGKFLVFGGNFDPATGREIGPTWILRQDLLTGERMAVARPQKPHQSTPLLDRSGRKILYRRADRNAAGRQVHLVDIDGKEDRELFNCGDALKTSASWLPDGSALVVSETPSHIRVGRGDVGTGEVGWIVDDPGRQIEGAYSHPLDPRAVLVEIRDARRRASFLDLATGKETALPAENRTIVPLGSAADGNWIAQAYSAELPATLVRLGPSGVEPLLPPPQDAVGLTAPHDVRWHSTDGLPVQGWLYSPAERARGLIVQVHGGPTAHAENAFEAWVQVCVAAGFAVLAPNYRGSTGFGPKFKEAIKEDGWGGREQDDIRAGIEAMIARGVVAPGNVGVTGTSYGGYSSWCAITRWPREIVAAAAPICGMTDLVIDYETTRPDLRTYSEEMFGGSPAEKPALYRERSPLHFVRNIRGRLLIVQGMKDPNVTPENVAAVEAALQEAGVPYEKLTFADEGHGIGKPANMRLLYARLIEFFADAFA